MMTVFISHDFAKLFGHMHEDNQPWEQSDTERRMDYVNNAAGRAVGQQIVADLGWLAVTQKYQLGLAGELATSSIAKAVAAAIKAKKMTRIVRFDGAPAQAGSCSASTCPTCRRVLSSDKCLKGTPACTVPDLSAII